MAVSPDKSFWTEAKFEEAKRLDGQGLSAAQIARAIGAQSRNAVLAKFHRMGVRDNGRKRMQRGKTKAQASPKIARALPTGANVLRFPPPPNVEYKITGPLPASRNLRIADPGFHAQSCKWPTMTDTAGEQRFCCAPKDHGPYCDGHAAKGFKYPNAKETATIAELIKYVKKHA